MKKNKPCYYCGEEGSNIEHIPPQQLFSGFPCDSITVPSCEAHNAYKSRRDNIIIKAFLIAAQGDSKRRQLDAQVIQAISQAEPNFKDVKGDITRAPFIVGESDKSFAQETAFVGGYLRIPEWWKQVTAGLVWDCLQKFDSKNEWDTADSFSYNLIKQNENGALTKYELSRITAKNSEIINRLSSHSWIQGWSSTPRPYPSEIYNFKILFTKERIVFRHDLFRDFNWYVAFVPSSETEKGIKDKIRIV